MAKENQSNRGTPATDIDRTQTTLAIIEQFGEKFNQRDLDAVMALMTDDCRFENTYPSPDGTPVQGQEAVRRAFAEVFASSSQMHFEVEELFAAGERSVVRWIYHWQDQRGEKGHVRGVDIFRVENNKVAEKLSYVKG